MFALAIASMDFGHSAPRRRARSNWAVVACSASAKSCAAAIVLIAILAPNCCLDGSHAHGAGIDGFGPTCFSRAALG
jgi:hypothetical protein